MLSILTRKSIKHLFLVGVVVCLQPSLVADEADDLKDESRLDATPFMQEFGKMLQGDSDARALLQKLMQAMVTQDGGQLPALDDQDNQTITFDSPQQERTAEEQERIDAKAMKTADHFEQTYLRTYFPKAFVTTEEHFAGMTPEAIEQSLGRGVELLGQTPWFYFQNQPKGFQLGEYWEHMIETFRIMHSFLQRSYVDPKTGSLIVLTPDDFFDTGSGHEDRVKLLKYLNELGKKNQFDFYALYFDYLIKMFNEGVRFQDEPQARRYKFELQRIFEKLKDSDYEPYYREALGRARELYDLLKRRTNFGSTFG